MRGVNALPRRTLFSRLPWRLHVALGLCVIVALVTSILGIIYLARGQFMPYHAEAVAASWEDVPSGYQTLILGLMRLTGAGWLVAAGVTLILAARCFDDPGSRSSWLGLPVSGAFILLAAARDGHPARKTAIDARHPWRLVMTSSHHDGAF